MDHRQFSTNLDGLPETTTKEKISKAMKAYLARAKAHGKIIYDIAT